MNDEDHEREDGERGGPASARRKDEASANQPPSDPPKAKKKLHVPWWAWVVLVLLLVAGVVYWLLAVRGYENTDDAYTDGRAVPMATKVSGYVRTLAVDDNQPVKKGDLLLVIDSGDYQTSVASAEAQLAQAHAQLDSARLDLQVQETSQDSNVSSAEAARAQAKANLDKALADYKRQKAVDPLATTQQQTDQIANAAVIQRQMLKDAEAKLRTAQLAPQNIAIAETKVKQLEAQVQAGEAQLDQAKLNLGYTELRAPMDGFVTKRNVEAGAFVQAGQTLLNMVGNEIWVTANFKEDQLVHMRPQQPVSIRVDAFPDLKLKGHVDSYQLGSGSRFSAFPAENATGNFVKIVQRVPVKILIDEGLDPQRPLPLGLSVVPTVDVR